VHDEIETGKVQTLSLGVIQGAVKRGLSLQNLLSTIATKHLHRKVYGGDAYLLKIDLGSWERGTHLGIWDVRIERVVTLVILEVQVGHLV
jgi:hypothetical protein